MIKPIIPKEHGAWTMLFMPFFISSGVAWCFDIKMVFTCFSILFLYLIRKPIEELIRYDVLSTNIQLTRKNIYFWLIVYGSLAVLLVTPLFYKYNLKGLLPFGFLFFLFLLMNVIKLKSGKKKSMYGDLVGIAGLCMTAPAGYYVATGKINRFNFLIWCVVFIYYGRSVFYVNLRVMAKSKREQFRNWLDKAKFAKSYINIHIYLIVTACILSVIFNYYWLIAAYIPITIQAIIGILNLDRNLNVKSLGYTEVCHSFIFAGIVVWACR